MLAVEGPLVEGHLHQPPAGQHARAEQQRERVDLRSPQVEPAAHAHHVEMQLDEAERIAQPVPPEVDSVELAEDGIDGVPVRSEHRRQHATAASPES